jgi:hypothetical protein
MDSIHIPFTITAIATYSASIGDNVMVVFFINLQDAIATPTRI